MNLPDLQGTENIRYITAPAPEPTPEQLAEKCNELAETLTLCSAFTIALLRRQGGEAQISECEIAGQMGGRLAWQANRDGIRVFVLGGMAAGQA